MRSIGIAALLLAATPAVSLTAQAGPLVVRSLKFDGNKAIDDLTLASVIATSGSAWLASSPLVSWIGLGEERFFNEQNFRRDVVRLRVVYAYSGYYEAAIDTVLRRTDEDVHVTFRITEGEPTRVTTLDVEGLEGLEEPDRLLRDLPLAVGDPINLYLLAATTDTIAQRLRNAGYPTAVVDTVTRIDPAQRTAAIRLLVTPGRPAVFGPVQVTGFDAVDSGFVTSLLTAREGRRYQVDALYRSQRALYQSELFRFASIGIDTTQFRPGDAVVPLRVEVAEGRTHRARASAGYATGDCFRFGAGWTARNFLGNGRVVDVSGRISKVGVGAPFSLGLDNSICSGLAADTVGSRLVNFGVDVALRRHAFLSPDNTLVLTIFSERRSEYAVYLRDEVGTELALTRETRAQIPVTLGYRLSFGRTQANQVSFCQFFNACLSEDVAQLRERRVLTTLTLSAVRQRTNNLLDPTRGSVLSAEATVSSKYLGSSSLQQFVRLVTDGSVYLPVGRRSVLAGRLKAGVIFSPRVELGSGSTNFVPPEQRFYAGGPNDLRGYERNELGPVVYVVPRDSLKVSDTGDTTYSSSDLRVAATGGDRLALGSVEFRFPAPLLSDRFRLAAFVDAGALWSRTGTAGLRITPGAGLRVESPLGPVRFDVGYNPYQLEEGAVYTAAESGDLVLVRNRDRRERDRRYTIHFSIGHAF